MAVKASRSRSGRQWSPLLRGPWRTVRRRDAGSPACTHLVHRSIVIQSHGAQQQQQHSIRCLRTPSFPRVRSSLASLFRRRLLRSWQRLLHSSRAQEINLTGLLSHIYQAVLLRLTSHFFSFIILCKLITNSYTYCRQLKSFLYKLPLIIIVELSRPCKVLWQRFRDCVIVISTLEIIMPIIIIIMPINLKPIWCLKHKILLIIML